MLVRPAGKARSWYQADPTQLAATLNGYMEKVTTPDLPTPGARVIIAPHAGYTFSGPCAAWAYRHLDLSGIRRVFILGPSHTYYVEGAAVTTFDEWATPFGNFKVDKTTLAEVQQAAGLPTIPQRNDQNEHSMEMQIPYLWMRCKETFQDPQQFPPIVPIIVGDGRADEEKALGAKLAPYFKDPENAFIISSDFCHWGEHFSYMPYSADKNTAKLTHLRADGSTPKGAPIHETIAALDEEAMEAVRSGDYNAFRENLRKTKNTVCGRHPIGVAMAALEVLRKDTGDDGDKGKFKVVKYDRSNLVESTDDFSVSYVSAYAVL